jgi:hypothetical protein
LRANIQAYANLEYRTVLTLGAREHSAVCEHDVEPDAACCEDILLDTAAMGSL